MTKELTKAAIELYQHLCDLEANFRYRLYSRYRVYEEQYPVNDFVAQELYVGIVRAVNLAKEMMENEAE
jgi:hypothetical protein